jgi:hypothetical protein
MPSKALRQYLSNYKGIDDPHLRAFRLLKNKYSVEKVLYPGCWIHLTPSLVFPHVVYVDLFNKMKPMLSDPELLEYIGTNSEIFGKSTIQVHQTDFRNGIDEEKASFDLLISLSSGFVSKYCASYLREKGLLFVNNEHYDATMAYVSKNFFPIGVFTFNGKLIQQTKEIEKYFLTTKDQEITLEMVMENSKKSPSKAKYKLKKKAPFYLF